MYVLQYNSNHDLKNQAKKESQQGASETKHFSMYWTIFVILKKPKDKKKKKI